MQTSFQLNKSCFIFKPPCCLRAFCGDDFIVAFPPKVATIKDAQFITIPNLPKRNTKILLSLVQCVLGRNPLFAFVIKCPSKKNATRQNNKSCLNFQKCAPNFLITFHYTKVGSLSTFLPKRLPRYFWTPLEYSKLLSNKLWIANVMIPTATETWSEWSDWFAWGAGVESRTWPNSWQQSPHCFLYPTFSYIESSMSFNKLSIANIKGLCPLQNACLSFPGHCGTFYDSRHELRPRLTPVAHLNHFLFAPANSFVLLSRAETA